MLHIALGYGSLRTVSKNVSKGVVEVLVSVVTVLCLIHLPPGTI